MRAGFRPVAVGAAGVKINGMEILHPGFAWLTLVALAVVGVRRRFFRFPVRHPRVDQFQSLGLRRPPAWLRFPRLLDWAAILLAVSTLLQPVLPIGQRRTVVKSLDLVLCLDLSASMAQTLEKKPKGQSWTPTPKSSAPSRMETVKQVAVDFIRNRPHDRIGLVVFSANAYVVNPLTTDHRVLSEYISMVDSNTLIGEGLTSVGAGLQASIDLIRFFGAGQRSEGRAVIVLTDAEQNYGLKPGDPLEEARRDKIKVYFVGIGEPIENILFDQMGLVRATGGDAFNAVTPQDLRRVSRQIDLLERNPVEITEYFRNQPLDLPLLVGAFASLVLGCALRALPVFYASG